MNPITLVVFALAGDGLKVYVTVMAVAVCVTAAIHEGHRHG